MFNNSRFFIGTQISIDSPEDSQELSSKLSFALDKFIEIMPLDILIIGSEKQTQTLTGIIKASKKIGTENYYWFELLGEFPDSQLSERMVNHLGISSQGWKNPIKIEN